MVSPQFGEKMCRWSWIFGLDYPPRSWPLERHLKGQVAEGIPEVGLGVSWFSSGGLQN